MLDDGLGAAADHTKARISSLSVHADLLMSGFVPNEEKSLWEPTQIITWLWYALLLYYCYLQLVVAEFFASIDRARCPITPGGFCFVVGGAAS